MTSPLLLAAALALSSCSPSERDQTLSGVSRAEKLAQPPAAGAGDRAPVIMNNTGIPAAELQDRLEEAAGSVVLEEVVLDRALAQIVTDRGVTVTRRDVDAERALLLRSLEEDAKLNPAQAQLMLENLRRSRGLGPARFEALLARNAQLRALVRPEVVVTNEDVDRALAIEFGPAYRTRIIQMADAKELAKVRARLLALLRTPEEQRRTLEEQEEARRRPHTQQEVDTAAALFAQEAVSVSMHESAPRGGLVEALSPSDEAYPAMLRQALAGARPGDIGEILATGGSVWMFIVERPLPAREAPTQQDRDRTRARLTARAERMAMDRLARELLASANITVLDPSLRWSWESRPRQ